MNLKKNTFSYITWIIMLFFTGVTCTFFSLVLGQSLKMNIVLTAVLFVTVFFGFLFLTYVITGRFLLKKKSVEKYLGMESLNLVLERILVITLLSIGFVIRVLMMSTAGEEAAYFEVSKVTVHGNNLINSVQGSVYFYCRVLHFLFRIFGNQWIAGIWLQIFLQLIGAVLLYFGLRNIIAKSGSLVVLGLLMFAPFAVKAGLTYSPQMLYFCIFAIGFYFVTLLLKNTFESKKELILFTVLAGFAVGICCYVDITGFILIIPILCLLLLERENMILKPILQIFVCMGVLIVTLLGALFLDSLLSNTTILNVIHAWKVIYGSVEVDFNALTDSLQPDVILLAVLSCLGCVSFWRRKKTENFTPYVWMTAICLLLVFTGITTGNMNGKYLLYVLVVILAVVSVTELFYQEQLILEYTEEVEVESEKNEVDTNQENKKVEYIENPLPVPKKHIRKTMDYAFIPNESQMKYDIQVSDNDDFDLK